MSNRTEDLARKAVEPFLEENNCVLWDVIFEKEGALHYLKILFDSKENTSLSMEECEKLTPPLNKIIDEQDFMKANKSQVDILEIGSPGISRRLRKAEHFAACKGRTVRVTYRDEHGKSEVNTDVLGDYDGEDKSITIGENKLLLKQCIRIILFEELPQ